MEHSDPETTGSDTPEPQDVKDDDGVAARKLNTQRRLKQFQVAIDVSRNPTTYAHKNIDYHHQIRVLKIYPGRPGTELECRLLPCALEGAKVHSSPTSNTIPYTALSYYWGTDVASNKVYMFEEDKMQKSFAAMSRNPIARANALRLVGFTYIQNNLNKAFRQLRSEEKEVFVWADALCIHQKDNVEKTAQVARMHDVYMQAKEVCIWLGDVEGQEAKAENKRTFEFLNKILDLQHLEKYLKELQKNPDVLATCLSVVRLMESDWFKRRWIIQELALATHAHVRRGIERMEWEDFADSIALFMTKHRNIRQAHGPPVDFNESRNAEINFMRHLDVRALGANVLVATTSNLFRKSNEGQILQRLLSLEQLVSSMLLPFEATDPKDTIFAVLQIAKDTFRAPPIEQTDTKILTIAFHCCAVPLIGILLRNFDVQDFDQILLALLQNNNTTFARDTVTVDYTMLKIIQIIQWCIWAVLFLLIWAVCSLAFGTLDRLFLGQLFRRVRGQCTPQIDKRLQPKYEKCIVDVFGDFIEYCVVTSNSLDVLCRHWAPHAGQVYSSDGTNMPIPSWILPISGHAFGGQKTVLHKRISGDSLVGGSNGRGCYKASGALLPEFEFGKKIIVSKGNEEPTKERPEYAEKVELQELPQRFDGTLMVKGFKLGTIQQSAAIIGGVISQQALEILGWSTVKKSPQSHIDRVWRTLVANRGPDGTNPPTWYRRVCQYCLEGLNIEQVGDFSTDGLKRLENTPPAIIRFLDRVQEVVWGRRCFRTAKENQQELVGLAPPTIEAGDLICILFGCSVPVVLRERKVEKTFQFIGECYVHGMMDGEAVDPMPKGSKIQWFTLK